jgi:hypothetical protein
MCPLFGTYSAPMANSSREHQIQLPQDRFFDLTICHSRTSRKIPAREFVHQGSACKNLHTHPSFPHPLNLMRRILAYLHALQAHRIFNFLTLFPQLSLHPTNGGVGNGVKAA